MWNMMWPVLVVVLSNVIYNISQKSTPNGVNAFFTLLVTYLIAAAVTAVIFLCTSGLHSVPKEIHKLNWASLALGVAIIGLEVGNLFLYRAGWKISIGSLVTNIALAVVLLFVGMLFYKESITMKQLIGMVVCSLGLILITG